MNFGKNHAVLDDFIFADNERSYYITAVEDPGSTHSGRDIFLVNSEGVEQRLTNLNAFDIFYFDISPDGRQLFFLTQDPGTRNLGTLDRFWALSLDDKKEIKSIVEANNHNFNLELNFRISADGRYVAFTKNLESKIDRKFRYELFLTDTLNKKTIQLTHLNQNVSFPRFCHHQNKIIFANDINWLKGEPVYELWEINIDGTGLKKINLSINKGSNQES